MGATATTRENASQSVKRIEAANGIVSGNARTPTTRIDPHVVKRIAMQRRSARKRETNRRIATARKNALKRRIRDVMRQFVTARKSARRIARKKKTRLALRLIETSRNTARKKKIEVVLSQLATARKTAREKRIGFVKRSGQKRLKNQKPRTSPRQRK